MLFCNDIRRSLRALYLSLVRSQFEHCSPIWRPIGKTMLDKLESFQKLCIKWILSEEYIRYNSYIIYIQKCRQVNLLPLAKRFDLNDLILFHKIVYSLIPLDLPYYLSYFNGSSRLRSCHLDHLSFVCNLETKNSSTSHLAKSFFYRTYTKWNALPLNIREIDCSSSFKEKVDKYLWKDVLHDIDGSDTEVEDDLLDNG